MIDFDLGNRCQCSKTFGRHCLLHKFCIIGSCTHRPSTLVNSNIQGLFDVICDSMQQLTSQKEILSNVFIN